jgi:hypothetical protein
MKLSPILRSDDFLSISFSSPGLHRFLKLRFVKVNIRPPSLGTEDSPPRIASDSCVRQTKLPPLLSIRGQPIGRALRSQLFTWRDFVNTRPWNAQPCNPQAKLRLESRSTFLLLEALIASRISEPCNRFKSSILGMTQWPPITPGKYLIGGKKPISS